MLNESIEQLKRIIRAEEPNLSDEKIDLLAEQLMWLARLAIEDYMKVMRLTRFSAKELSKAIKKEDN